jgi:hypothetical protein
MKTIPFPEFRYDLDARQPVGLFHVIAFAFRAPALVQDVGHDDCYYLRIERSAAAKVRHWNSAPHREDGMGRQERSLRSPDEQTNQNI